MSGFLYFIPKGKHDITLPQLKKIGLGYALERMTPREVPGKGPDGNCGVIVADDRFVGVGDLGYFPTKQQWMKIPKIDAWVGMTTDSPPSPDQLQRKVMLNGHFVSLGDGNEYIIPVARGQVDQGETIGWYNALPKSTGLDEAGNWTESGMLPRYEHLWNLANNWWDAQIEAEIEIGAESKTAKITFDFEGLLDAALGALQANYRVGKAEVVMLGLLNGNVPSSILNALVDIPTIAEWFKKKASGPSVTALNTQDGEAA